MCFFEVLNIKYLKRIGSYSIFEELYNHALEQEPTEMKDEEFKRTRNRRNFKDGEFKKQKTELSMPPKFKGQARNVKGRRSEIEM